MNKLVDHSVISLVCLINKIIYNGIVFYIKLEKKTYNLAMSSLLLLLLTIIVVSSFLHPTYSICIDFHDPINLRNSSMVDCTPKQNDDVSDNNFEFDNSDLFHVNFNCQINDTDLCNNVEKTFNMAGDIITYALTINTPIIVKATFSKMDPTILGGAAPTRYISLLD
jgi:hypothetical protein